MWLIEKEKIVEYLNAINPCKACTAYGEGAIDMISHTLSYLDLMPEVDAAKIQKLCNEIEDVVSDIAFNSTHYHIYDCCQAIRDKLKEIGKELTGNDD